MTDETHAELEELAREAGSSSAEIEELAGKNPRVRRALERALNDEERYCTLGDAAIAFGVSLVTVQKWAKEPDFPVAERGGHGKPYKIPVNRVMLWRALREEKAELARQEGAEDARQAALELGLTEDPEAVNGAGGPLTPSQRNAYYEAELRKTKIAKERRELVSAEAVRLEWSRANALIRERIRSLPDELERRGLADEKAAAVMIETIDDALADLAAALEQMPDHAAA